LPWDERGAWVKALEGVSGNYRSAFSPSNKEGTHFE